MWTIDIAQYNLKKHAKQNDGNCWNFSMMTIAILKKSKFPNI